jgi:F-type H+-transporting ATPase subunit epsilon
MMTLLGTGVLRLGGGGGNQRFNVAGGFLQVVDNVVRVVTEKASAV